MKNRWAIWVLMSLIILLLVACGGDVAVQEEGNMMAETAVTQSAENDMRADMADNMDDDMRADMADDMGDGMNADMPEDMNGEMTGDMEGEMVDDMGDDMNADMADDMDDDMSDDMHAGMADDTAMMTSGPEWLALPLTNARSGETFTLADFSGKTVFVETMATWCSNCRRQLQNVSAAKGQLGDDVIFVALSVETNISDAELARYADNEGFDWLFAVATPELLQKLADEYGRAILNPPSTPHFIVRPDGSTTDLVTGIDSPDTLVNDLLAVAMQ